MKKVVIIGPESTGKSQLAAALARSYACDWVPEYARSYIESLNRSYTVDDLSAIAQGQKIQEYTFALKENRLLICDTNAEVIKVWSENAFGFCAESILRQIAEQHYSLVLLADIDLPWQADVQREHPNITDRARFFEIYKDIAVQSGMPFGIVRGIGDARVANAISLIKKYTGEAPVH